MSHSQSSHAAQPAHGNDKPAADAKKPPRDKAKDKDLLLALMATDWLHGDRHFQAQITKLTLALLKDLDGGPDAKDPTEEQLLAQEAEGRIEGLPTGIRAAQEQPAQRIDEARQPAPTKAA